MDSNFICPLCDKSFSKRFNLTRHMSNVHNQLCDVPLKRNTSFICTICSHGSYNFSSYVEHISKEHEIILKTETLNFKNSQEFFSWKSDVEENENVCFFRKTAAKNVLDGSVTYYHCSRSGFFQYQKERKRELKIQGSCKINGFCPSRVKAKFLNDGSVVIDYCSSHVGHKSELAHMPLLFKERQNIATQLANKVPFTEVLNSARASLDEKNLRRIQLLTRHDLYNIETEFGLNNDSVRHTNDALSVEAWVESEKQSESNCVICYKPGKGVRNLKERGLFIRYYDGSSVRNFKKIWQ